MIPHGCKPHDSSPSQSCPSRQEMVELLQEHLWSAGHTPQMRGRPARLSLLHLCLGLILTMLHGLHSQLDVWRRLRQESIGPFAALGAYCDQAFYNRLAQAY